MRTSKITPATRAVFQVKIESLSEELRIIRRRADNIKRLSAKKLLRQSAARITAKLPPIDDLTRMRANDRAHRQDQLAAAITESHARLVVKPEIRHTLLAYGFARGMPYNKMEQTCRVKPVAEDISRIVKSLWQDFPKIDVKPADIESWLAAVPNYIT